MSRSIGFPEMQSLIAIYGPDELLVAADCDVDDNASATILPVNFKFSGILRCAPLFLLFCNAIDSFVS